MQTRCARTGGGKGLRSRRASGDWGGLEALRPELEAWLARRCSDSNEVDDVIQETFLRAARYRSSLARPEGLKGWVMRIAANVYNDRYSWCARTLAVPGDEGLFDSVEGREPDPGDSHCEESIRVGQAVIEKGTLVREMLSALDGLADRDRRVLTSYYGGAQSCLETAGDCDVPARLVKVHLFRARRRLARALRVRVRAGRC